MEKPGIEHTTPGLEGKWLNHYTTEASFPLSSIKINPNTNESKEEGHNNNNQGGGTKNMYNNFPILEITVRIVLSCKLVT